VLVSAASAWEIPAKHRLGRLDGSALVGQLGTILVAQRFGTLDITINHDQSRSITIDHDLSTAITTGVRVRARVHTRIR
jgi:PIN domain nuclease of toxin-antitoxin system